MSYIDAAEHAKKAAAAAQEAKIYYYDNDDRNLAEGVEQLALAVEALARQLHRDS